jgi:hypothetical protein
VEVSEQRVFEVDEIVFDSFSAGDDREGRADGGCERRDSKYLVESY